MNRDEKAAVLFNVEEKSRLTKEVRDLEVDFNKLNGDIKKMKQHIDPSALTLDDVMLKLKAEDNSKFRKVMEDLRMDGQDPAWFKLDWADDLNNISKEGASVDRGSVPYLQK